MRRTVLTTVMAAVIIMPMSGFTAVADTHTDTANAMSHLKAAGEILTEGEVIADVVEIEVESSQARSDLQLGALTQSPNVTSAFLVTTERDLTLEQAENLPGERIGERITAVRNESPLAVASGASIAAIIDDGDEEFGNKCRTITSTLHGLNALKQTLFTFTQEASWCWDGTKVFNKNSTFRYTTPYLAWQWDELEKGSGINRGTAPWIRARMGKFKQCMPTPTGEWCPNRGTAYIKQTMRVNGKYAAEGYTG